MARFRSAPWLAAALACALLVFGTTGCDGSGDSAGEEPAGPSGKSGAVYPVTVKHTWGSTTITSEPQRIVTVGLTDQDAVLALGKVPIATTEWLGGYPGAIGPWAQDRVGDTELPTVLKDTGTGPQVEKIAALKPDVILALHSGLTKEQYTSLSKLAPVVAQPEQYGDYRIPWQELTQKVGLVLGKPVEAMEAITDTEAQIAAATRIGFKDARVVMATRHEGMFVFGSHDPRSRLLGNLGFRLPQDLDTVIGNRFGATIGKERMDLLDQDAVVWIVSDVAKDRAELHKDPSYRDLTVVSEGREVFVHESGDYGRATSFASVLSLPYVVERLALQLAFALDGMPESVVDQPMP
ncbi:iron-siderophore ABC transporter substrate-binding protein [Streptomyces sp. NBC_00690]|uniref:iron-siderophore ABC transporter substrate-binding protein n=1 Tax=Streptomyces sp. NBC_00690 TaxID=2975808 RepID=UPI002E282ADB|nr:iron-siderophore ABC transporter substrate-binding protein [Streptomyces sp. NBC_00690]